MCWKAHATFSPKISRTRVFDLTRTCDDKQRAHLPKAVEMADRGSGDRGSHNSLIRGCDCLPSRAIANTTSCDDSKTIGVDLADDPPTPAPDLDIRSEERRVGKECSF